MRTPTSAAAAVQAIQLFRLFMALSFSILKSEFRISKSEISSVPSGRDRILRLALGLLFLVFGERLVQLLDGDLLLLGAQDDLTREDDGHRSGRLAQEVVHRSPEPGLRVFDGGREVRTDLRGALHAERLHGIGDKARAEINRISQAYGFDLDPDALVEDLGVGERQRIEILKVLYRGAKIIILDEPTAVLVPQEVDALFDNLRELKSEGHTILFISHKLDEVLDIADDITVMRRGTTVNAVDLVFFHAKEKIRRAMGVQHSEPNRTAPADDRRVRTAGRSRLAPSSDHPDGQPEPTS